MPTDHSRPWSCYQFKNPGYRVKEWKNLLKSFIFLKKKCQVWWEVNDEAIMMQSFMDLATVIICNSLWNTERS